MKKFKKGQYVVGSSDSDYWEGTKATTLTGAKRIATKIFEPSVSSRISVARFDGEEYLELSVKYGYGNWITLD